MFDYERLEALSIEGEAPQSEPERQYYFMKKARAILKQKAEELGLTNTHFENSHQPRLQGGWKIQCKLPPKTKAILPP